METTYAIAAACPLRSVKRAVILAAVIVIATLGASAAQAQRIVLGVHFGLPLYWPAPYYYYPPPYYVPPYYPPYVYVPPPAALPPPALTERDGYYWYYCPSAGAYYPYVRQCPQGWQRIPSVPPA